MARISHNSSEVKTSSNPTSRYMEWKSNDQAFEFYDKNVGQKIKVELPMKFLFLQHYHTVRGYSEASNSGIYANEVFYIGSEPMAVRSHKGGLIVEGLYKDIKSQVLAAGGKYHRSVYGMLEDGTIVNLSFKGAVVSEWSNFMDDNKNNVDNAWIEVNEAKQMKKGSVKYSVPQFTLGKAITKVQSDMADNAASKLKTHFDAYFAKEEATLEEDGLFD
jgi:hypothetical protein